MTFSCNILAYMTMGLHITKKFYQNITLTKKETNFCVCISRPIPWTFVGAHGSTCHAAFEVCRHGEPAIHHGIIRRDQPLFGVTQGSVETDLKVSVTPSPVILSPLLLLSLLLPTVMNTFRLNSSLKSRAVISDCQSH